MIQYWVSYWNEETGELEDGKGLVCASLFSEAIDFLKRWYGDIEEIHYLSSVGVGWDDHLIEKEEIATLNWDNT